jgi:hypothetical protein
MKFPRYMMATTALHQLGDISRDKPDLCRVESEEGDNYVGAWVTGFGFFNVKFPKATTRELTKAEIKKHDKRSVRIGSQPAIPLRVRELSVTKQTAERSRASWAGAEYLHGSPSYSSAILTARPQTPRKISPVSSCSGTTVDMR